MECDYQGKTLVAHTPNTGSMKNLLIENSKVILLHDPNPKRKLHYTTQLMIHPNSVQIGINTHLPNKLIFEALETKQINELKELHSLKREVSYGEEQSKIDIFALDKHNTPTYIEIKTVTLKEEDSPNVGQFPDSVSTRGQKHLRELSKEVQKGNRAILVFLVNRDDVNQFGIAKHIDPQYYQEYLHAKQTGVEILALQANYKYNTKKKELTCSIGKRLKIID